MNKLLFCEFGLCEVKLHFRTSLLVLKNNERDSYLFLKFEFEYNVDKQLVIFFYFMELKKVVLFLSHIH